MKILSALRLVVFVDFSLHSFWDFHFIAQRAPFLSRFSGFSSFFLGISQKVSDSYKHVAYSAFMIIDDL